MTTEPVFESDAELLRSVPMSLFSTSGKLRLEDGWLSFRTMLRKRVVFEGRVEEFHSIAPMTSRGMHLWHGATRYRLTVGLAAGAPMTGLNNLADAAIAAASLPAAQADDARNQVMAAKWVDLLAPRVGSPPPDLKVRPPWPYWTWPVGIVLGALGFAGAIIGATFAFA